jgi:signal transduction histidine kinase
MDVSLTAACSVAAGLEAAKLEALYHFAYGLSHEINNPLANIATRAQSLLANETDPERRRKLATIVQQALRAHEMIADLMLFARPPTPRPEAVDLVRLTETVVAELQPQAVEQGTKLLRTGDNGPHVARVDPTQIAVAVKALVQNALEAVKAGGIVEVGVAPGSRVRDHEPGDTGQGAGAGENPRSPIPNLKFLLTVADTGPGIPPEIRPHIFDPFFSGREAGRGLGLGLSKAWRLVTLHGGTITVESEPGAGARFSILLPAE